MKPTKTTKTTKTIQAYECTHCGKLYKTEKGVLKHEKTCGKNYEYQEEKKRKEELKLEFKKDINDVRLTSKNIEEVIKRTIEVLDKHGIILELKSYPSNFKEDISNTHNSPIGRPQNFSHKPDLPKSYPGYYGQWVGKIRRKDNKYIRFRDIYSGSSHFAEYDYNIDYFQTGTGSAGENFSISGILFIEDFPCIYGADIDKYFIKENQDIFDNLFNTVEEDYNKKLNEYIKNDKQTILIYDLIEQLSQIRNDLLHQNKHNKDFLTSVFYKENNPNLPEIKEGVLDIKKYLDFKNKFTGKIKEPSDVSDIAKKIEDITSKVQNIKDENPHWFI